MTIREITKFATDDGSEFDTRTEAERYLARTALAGQMRDDLNLRETSFDEIADWILTYYDITPRPEAP